jgi:hypothetical protein
VNRRGQSKALRYTGYIYDRKERPGINGAIPEVVGTARPSFGECAAGYNTDVFWSGFTSRFKNETTAMLDGLHSICSYRHR